MDVDSDLVVDLDLTITADAIDVVVEDVEDAEDVEEVVASKEKLTNYN